MAKAPKGGRIDMSYDPPKGNFYKVRYTGGTVYYRGYTDPTSTILQGQAIGCDSSLVAPALPYHDRTYTVDPVSREEAEDLRLYYDGEEIHEDYWIALTKFMPAQENEIFIEYDEYDMKEE